MGKSCAAIGEAYYTAMGQKDIASMGKYLDPDVEFIGPLARLVGKEAVLEATRKFSEFFKSIAVRAKFGTEDQAMIVYALDFPPPIGLFSSSALMTFQDGLIKKIELFYDARPFVK